MGLVTRRSEQLDKLFDQFAIDPKKPKATKKNDDKKEKDSKDKDRPADKGHVEGFCLMKYDRLLRTVHNRHIPR